MAIGIDDLYDEDDDILESPEQNQQQTYEPPSNEDSDYMSDFLKSRGIDDPSKIKFEDDNGTITERSWNDLSKEEQLNILNTPLEQNDNYDNYGLNDEEISLINTIRESGVTPSEYIKSIQGEQVVQEPQYKVDELSDDELYLLDLESRIGSDLSDDEAIQALNLAKQNEEFYKKQVDGIRKEYKEREDYNILQEKNEYEEQQREAFQEYQNKVIDAINNFNSIGNLDLNFEDKDKEMIYDFMLSQDESGSNYLYKALQDPNTLVRAAWFILNGDEAFNNISDYFIDQIKTVANNQYNKGFQDAKKGESSKPEVVINNNHNRNRVYKSIEDLYDED